MPSQTERRIETFEAFEDTAAYADGGLTRSQAITTARGEIWSLRDDFARHELRAVRVFMYRVEGDDAREFFSGEFDSGWVEARPPLNKAQRDRLTPMWKVEPR